MSDRTIEQLNDIEDIKQLKARYCRLIDQKKWDELQEALMADVAIEIAGAPGGADDTQRYTSARSFIDQLRAAMDPLTSVHQVHAPEIELLDSAYARGLWTVSDRLVFPAGSPLQILQGWGVYHETYKKVSGQWRIASLRIERLLVEPDAAPAPTDAKSVAGKLLESIGRRDLAGLKSLFADEVEWFVPGSSALPWTGRRTQGDQAPDFFTVMWSHFATGKSSANVDDIISDGGNVVITGTFTHVVEQNGNTFTTPVSLHIKVENGKIRYLQLYEDTLLISQAFGYADGAPAVGRNETSKSLTSTRIR